jgi:molybdopterin/thiamine biosynthesis adenylyltransferase
MSRLTLSLSTDLKQLRADGYEIEVRKGAFLVAKNVPYVNSVREIKFGTLVCPLNVAGDRTGVPSDHTLYFAGEHPCNLDGSPLSALVNSAQHQTVAGIAIDYYLSNKPPAGSFVDYHEKIKHYAGHISAPATAMDSSIRADGKRVIEPTEEDESVFHYVEDLSGRYSIDSITSKLEIPKVAIIGVGGTGSYVLDLVAKTPVKEIHIFDGDAFYTHNAFRTPGAPSLAELKATPSKVGYLAARYSNMRKNIHPHEHQIDETNLDDLREMTFVFLCIDDGASKKSIIDHLERVNIPFVDVGMGLYVADESLSGQLRVTTGTQLKRDHLPSRIAFDAPGGNPYATNLQIADLNCLNAALAVVKWKKLFGFYHDLKREHHSSYTINTNRMINEDRP